MFVLTRDQTETADWKLILVGNLPAANWSTYYTELKQSCENKEEKLILTLCCIITCDKPLIL